jgi:hypothetical protein
MGKAGLSADCLRLVENPTERQIIILALDMIVEDQPLSQAAEQLNRRGHRTRQGKNWTPTALFNLLPRMIEVGPRLFVSEEWTHRRERLPRVVWRLLSGRHGNFDARLGSRQPRDSYGGPRRPRVFEVSGVHCVHAREQVHVREIAYDVAAAQRKIREAGLPPILADRLTVGR